MRSSFDIKEISEYFCHILSIDVRSDLVAADIAEEIIKIGQNDILEFKKYVKTQIPKFRDENYRYLSNYQKFIVLIYNFNEPKRLKKMEAVDDMCNELATKLGLVAQYFRKNNIHANPDFSKLCTHTGYKFFSEKEIKVIRESGINIYFVNNYGHDSSCALLGDAIFKLNQEFVEKKEDKGSDVIKKLEQGYGRKN